MAASTTTDAPPADLTVTDLTVNDMDLDAWGLPTGDDLQSFLAEMADAVLDREDLNDTDLHFVTIFPPVYDLHADPDHRYPMYELMISGPPIPGIRPAPHKVAEILTEKITHIDDDWRGIAMIAVYRHTGVHDTGQRIDRRCVTIATRSGVDFHTTRPPR